MQAIPPPLTRADCAVLTEDDRRERIVARNLALLRADEAAWGTPASRREEFRRMIEPGGTLFDLRARFQEIVAESVT